MKVDIQVGVSALAEGVLHVCAVGIGGPVIADSVGCGLWCKSDFRGLISRIQGVNLLSYKVVTDVGWVMVGLIEGSNEVGVNIYLDLLRRPRVEMWIVTEGFMGIFELLAGLLGVARLGADVWDIDDMDCTAQGSVLVGGAGRKGKGWDGGRGENEQGLEQHFDVCI